MTRFVAGIDVGTTSIKGVVVDVDTGVVVGQAEHAYPSATPRSGWVEQDPNDWLAGIRVCVERLGATVTRPPISIGVCSQVNTHVFVNDELRPTRPAINWQDQRCAPIARELDASVADRRLHIWGGPFTIDASCALARAAWVARHEPAVWDRTRWLLSPKDYCIGVMTGAVRSDRISPIGLVGADGQYLDEALGLVDGAVERLAPLGEFDAAAGVTSGSLGLPAGVPVAIGTMDVWGALYGSGVVDAGSGVQLSGTSEVIGLFSNRPGSADGIISFPPVRGRYLHAGPTQAGGEALRWIAATLGLDPPAALALAEQAAANPQPLVFLPHLAGERAPIWSAEARGVFVGLTSRSGAGDLVLGVLEGVAHAACEVRRRCERAANVRPDVLRLSGGASRSRLWNQIKADTHDRVMEVVAGDATGAVGAALMGAVAAGVDDDLESLARRIVRIRDVVEPDARRVGRLERLHDVYLDAGARLVTPFAALHAMEHHPPEGSDVEF